MNREQLIVTREQLTINREKRAKKYYSLFFIICSLFFVITCQDPFEPPVNQNDNNVIENGFICIYIDQNNSERSSRAVQPAREEIAGYQLTFSGSGTRTPVNITEGNSANVALADGTWTVTAKAYKLGGTIGKTEDEIASGSILLTVSGGAVSGTVPPIILMPSTGIGNGTLTYNITIDSGVTGFFKLFQIDGSTLESSFGNNGEIIFSNSINGNINLSVGRYIAEIELTKEDGDIALRREVIEIWSSSTTVFSFEPSVFVDPDMILPTINYGNFTIESIDLNNISYANSVLTVNKSGSYVISMRLGVTSSTTEHIVVANGVTADIILSSVNINNTTANTCAFDMAGANVNLSLINDNVLRSGSNRAGLQVPSGSTLIISEESTGSLTVTGGNYGAGIGGGSGNAGGNISILGGTVNATGGFYSAGIGGGNNGASGNISILSGTVNTTGGSSGAGIGGGNNGAGGNISILGGTVTATGGSSGSGIGGGSSGAGGDINISGSTVIAAGGTNGAGIGAGNNGTNSGTINAINGNAVVFASSIQPALPTGANLMSAIVYIGNTGTIYGNVTLARNVIIPSGRSLNIPNGQTLTIQNGYTLTNNGTITIFNVWSVNGSITGNLPTSYGAAFMVSGGTAYTYVDGVLTITGNGTYTIEMNTTTLRERIVVASGVTVNITMSNVNINMSGNNGLCAFDMSGTTVNLTLIGDNILRSGSNRAGIQAPSGSTLVITEASTGSLTVTGGNNSAGIGGGNGSAGGSITINGGTITATGGSRGAGIGGGRDGTGGTLTAINGNAVVFASSIQPALPTGGNIGPAIVFNGNNGTMYGNVTLSRNETISSGMAIDIRTGQTLAIQSGYTMTNNGTIVIYDGGILTGTLIGNQPIEPVFTITGGTAYTYTGRILTITGNGTYMIGMKSGVTSTTAERIVVSSGVTAEITISNVNINMSSNYGLCAFDMTGATVNLTLVGDNVLRSGEDRAGLEAPSGSTLVITAASTGSLAVTRGVGGAGIGGGGLGSNINQTGGNITIAGGTVTTTGGNGAGIGGGISGSGGTVRITGGIVNAINTYGNGIGGGSGSGTITAITGNAVVFASSGSFGVPIQPALPTGANIGPAIVFNGVNGTMYGNVTLAQNITIPSDRHLYILNGQTLTIQNDYALTNNGTIVIQNGGNIIGTIIGNQPIEPSFVISGDSAYTYNGGILNITGNGTYSIGMRDGVTSTATDRIVIASGVTANITLLNVNIDIRNAAELSAFDMTGATVNLTLTGDNVLRSGSDRAGIEAPSGSTLVITAASTGSLAATGNSRGAGIGGGGLGSSTNQTGGNITIAGGTVTATGGGNGAGIGGGISGSGGTVRITGGIVTVINSHGNGIGGGYSESGGTITAINGNAVVFASSGSSGVPIQPTLPTGTNLGPAIVFNGLSGIMYGNVTLAQSITIPTGRLLDISNGQTLTIQNGYALTNNGTIVIQNGGNIIGTVIGNQPTESSLVISGGTAHNYFGGILTITGNGTYTIGMRDGVTSTTAERIVVSSGVTADITMSNVNINMSSNAGLCAFDMTGATVNLTLVGDNVLRSGSDRAGIEVPSGSTLVITAASTGSLAATGNSRGAGIGGGGLGSSTNQTGGNITIAGGTVTATGGGNGAGIGGGISGSGGTVRITGGIVTVTNGWNGIGAGSIGSSGGTITAITGNAVVFATSGSGVPIQPTLPTGTNLGPAIIFISNSGTMYGNITLAYNVTIPSGRILDINNGQVLTIPSGITLTNNGTIANGGTIYRYGIIAGTGIIAGNPVVW